MAERVCKFAIPVFAAFLASAKVAAAEVTAATLRDDGYRIMNCVFTERCLIGQPCERAYRDMRWFLNEEAGRAYRHTFGGDFQRGELRLDTRWKDLSKARSILMPMREQVSSHLTVFHSGGAIYSFQYAADPGSGSFLRGTCESDAPSE